MWLSPLPLYAPFIDIIWYDYGERVSIWLMHTENALLLTMGPRSENVYFMISFNKRQEPIICHDKFYFKKITL